MKNKRNRPKSPKKSKIKKQVLKKLNNRVMKNQAHSFIVTRKIHKELKSMKRIIKNNGQPIEKISDTYQMNLSDTFSKINLDQNQVVNDLNISNSFLSKFLHNREIFVKKNIEAVSNDKPNIGITLFLKGNLLQHETINKSNYNNKCKDVCYDKCAENLLHKSLDYVILDSYEQDKVTTKQNEISNLNNKLSTNSSFKKSVNNSSNISDTKLNNDVICLGEITQSTSNNLTDGHIELQTELNLDDTSSVIRIDVGNKSGRLENNKYDSKDINNHKEERLDFLNLDKSIQLSNVKCTASKTNEKQLNTLSKIKDVNLQEESNIIVIDDDSIIFTTNDKSDDDDIIFVDENYVTGNHCERKSSIVVIEDDIRNTCKQSEVAELLYINSGFVKKQTNNNFNNNKKPKLNCSNRRNVRRNNYKLKKQEEKKITNAGKNEIVGCTDLNSICKQNTNADIINFTTHSCTCSKINNIKRKRLNSSVSKQLVTSVQSQQQNRNKNFTILKDTDVNNASVSRSNIDCINERLREIVIDGSNVAIGHSNGKTFSVKGLKIVLDYFVKRGHKVTAFVPLYRSHSRQSSDPALLNNLVETQLVVFTPSRLVNGKRITPYDDRFIIEYATLRKGVVVSNDNYRDLLHENNGFRETIERRLLMYTWVGDVIMFPNDPLGRYGPSLERFLRFY